MRLLVAAARDRRSRQERVEAFRGGGGTRRRGGGRAGGRREEEEGSRDRIRWMAESCLSALDL